MILDTSAVIALLRGEEEADSIAAAIAADPQPKMSVVSYVEAGVVADSARNATISRQLDEILRLAEVQIVAVTPEQGRLAREAYRDFGRGSGHPAKLNFGDCFSYALAKSSGEPLLFKGSDFARTDVMVAEPGSSRVDKHA